MQNKDNTDELMKKLEELLSQVQAAQKAKAECFILNTNICLEKNKFTDPLLNICRQVEFADADRLAGALICQLAYLLARVRFSLDMANREDYEKKSHQIISVSKNILEETCDAILESMIEESQK